MFAPELFRGGWALHILAGSLLFTAFFIATDPVTSPMTLRGRWLYGVFIGALVLILRGLTPDPEGVTFSVLVANAFVPLIDKYTAPRSFGGKR
jgi:electron transport complex protein RnfD